MVMGSLRQRCDWRPGQLSRGCWPLPTSIGADRRNLRKQAAWLALCIRALALTASVSEAPHGAESNGTGNWEKFTGEKPTTKANLLRLWDEQTATIDEKSPKIPPHRFAEVEAKTWLERATPPPSALFDRENLAGNRELSLRQRARPANAEICTVAALTVRKGHVDYAAAGNQAPCPLRIRPGPPPPAILRRQPKPIAKGRSPAG